MPPKRKGIYFILTTALISGFSIFINKYGISFQNPYVFTALKNIIVASFMFSLIIGSKDYQKLKKLKINNWSKLVLIGIIGGGIPFFLFFRGLTLTSAATASFIHKNMFLWVAPLAVIFLKEKLNKNYIIAALLLLLGNMLILGNVWHFDVKAGPLHILGATVLWAMEIIVSKRLLKKLPSNIVAWGRMFFGSIFLLIFLLATNQHNLIFNLNSRQILWIVITSILLFGYVVTWYKGLKILKATTASAILVLGSVITTILSLMSQSAFIVNEILGGVLIAFALYLLINLEFQVFKPKILNTKY